MRSDSIFRNRRLGGGLAVAMLLSAALAAAQTGGQPAVYRARTELVVLQVSVSDGQRRHVAGLQAENFTVFDEGVRSEERRVGKEWWSRWWAEELMKIAVSK